MNRRLFAISAVIAACAPKKRRVEPAYVEEPPPPGPDAEAIEMEDRIREEKRAEREKLGDAVTGDRARLFRTLGFPDGNASGKNDLASVKDAEWWMYGKRFRRLPDGTGEFECREVYFFDGDKIREQRSTGTCR